MLKRNLIIGTLLMGLFSTGLVAKDVEYEAAKKPEKTLKKDDLDIVAKLKKLSKVQGLTKAETKKIKEFLDDYVASAKKEKVAPSVGKKPNTGKPSKDKATTKNAKMKKAKK